MISVPNLLQRLSGNKIILLLLLSIFIGACSTTETLPRKRSRTKKPKKTTYTKVEVKSNVDTVEWTDIDTEGKPPISEFEEMGIEKESEYDISVLFPFNASQLLGADLTDSENRYLNYYSGMLMAVDILKNQGKALNINVHDIGSSSTDLSSKVSRYVDNDTDVIVAPFSKKQVVEVAKYGKAKKIPVVSPWLVSSTVTKENPYYIKLMPDIREYYFAIMEDVSQNFTAEQVVIVGENSDKSKIAYLQELAKEMYGTGEEDAVEEFIVDPDSLANGEFAFDSIFIREQPLVVIIPNYSSSDESLIYGCVRRLSVEKREQTVHAYGMPILLNSDRMEYDYFKSLNMRVARSKFVDKHNARIGNFKGDYFSRYGAIPTDAAYEGYDMMMYLGESIWEYGKSFQYHLDKKSDYYLQSAFDIQKKISAEDIEKERFDEIDYFVNKNVDIIEFKENKFSRQR